MNILYIILGVLTFLGLVITILAYIGLVVQKDEQYHLDQYNKKALDVFSKANKNKKLKRQSTPKVPTIDK